MDDCDVVTVARCDPNSVLNQNRGHEYYALTLRNFYLIVKSETDPYQGEMVWVVNDLQETVRVLKGRFTEFQNMTRKEFRILCRIIR